MKYIIIITFLTTLLGSNSLDRNVVKMLSSEEFKAQTENKSVQLIDVRTPKEFQSGHITGAENIDFYSDKFAFEFNKLDKNKAVYVYCRSGSRSNKASKRLVELGFIEIYDLKGGFLNYK